jgi:hypothetical protein
VKPDTLRDEHRPNMSENMVLRKISGRWRDRVTWDWKELQIVETDDLYSSPKYY